MCDNSDSCVLDDFEYLTKEDLEKIADSDMESAWVAERILEGCDCDDKK